MLEMAAVSTGQRILDIAAGAGEQSINAAKKVGPTGYVLATDISANILEFAKEMVQSAGFQNIGTKVMDGENLSLLLSSDNNRKTVMSRSVNTTFIFFSTYFL